MDEPLTEEKAREMVAEKRRAVAEAFEVGNLAVEKWKMARNDLSDAEFHLFTILKKKKERAQ